MNTTVAKPLRVRKWDLMSRTTKVILVSLPLILLLAAIAADTYWVHEQPKRELAHTVEALRLAKSWHVHYIEKWDFPSGEIDIDVVCPGFKHIFTLPPPPFVDPFDEIFLNGSKYMKLRERWVNWTDIERPPATVPDCKDGPMMNVGYVGGETKSLTLSQFLRDGTVKRGDWHEVDGEICREYLLSYPNPGHLHPYIPATLCVNETDHLPRELRAPVVGGANDERIVTYSQWNKYTEPQLPEGFSTGPSNSKR